MDDPRIRQLESFCAAEMPGMRKPHIENWRSIPGGWESEIFAFTLCAGSALQHERLELVLRTYVGTNAASKAAHEFRALRLLHKAGYPVPQVYAVGGEEVLFERPFILMDHINGEPLWGLMERAKGRQLQSWIVLFCKLFARLHSLDWRMFMEANGQTSEDPYRFVDAWLVGARQSLADSHFDDLTPIVDWLAQQRNDLACKRPAPLHQDFHPANILIRPDGEAYVIDWTSFTVSDPRFDLAWTLVLSDAYLGESVREMYFREYEHQSGTLVEKIETFEVFACARRLFDIFVSLGQGAELRGMRPEAVEAMKRDMPATRRVYQRLMKHTGLRFPRLEELWLKPESSR